MNATQLLAHFDRLAEAPGAVPRLRRFILDLAVRGKLVEQDAGDEPAAELLDRIRVAKAGLIKAGKLKRGAEEAPAADSEPQFVLPLNWFWAQLGEVAQYGISDKVDSNAAIPPSTWVLDLEDIEKDTSRLLNQVESEARPFSSTKTAFKRGDVLFGKLRPYLNKVIVADREGVCTTEIIPIRGYCGLVPAYTKMVLRSPLTMATVDRLMYGMKMPRLGTADATALSYPLPPLAEQHRIVAKVDELMVLCDQLEATQQERERRRDRMAAASLQRLNQPAADTTPEAQGEHARFHLRHLPRLTTRPEHIKALRQTIRKLAIVGQITRQDTNDEPASALLTKNLHWRTSAIKRKQIREPRKELLVIGGDDSPYRLPTQWSWARLGEVIYIQSGDGLTAANMNNGSIPVFGGNGVNGHHDAFNIDEPTLVIGRVGYYCGSIHITPDRAWVTDNAFVTHFCPNLFSLRFLALLLATTNLKENEGATAQPVISGSKIYPLIVGIPPLAEQHRIVAKVDELMALCDQLEAQLTTTQTDSRRLLEAVLEAVLISEVKSI